jgi:hypothetical protein
VHEAAFVVVVYPPTHVVHVRSTVVEGTFETDVPAAQVAHAVHDPALVPVENEPVPHGAQARSIVVVPGMMIEKPALQVTHAVHEVALVVVENPPTQVEQIWSAIEVPVVEMNWPATQVVYAVQVAEFGAVEKVFVAQGAQARSLVAVGAVVTEVPGAQVVSVVHVRSVVAVGAADSN